MDGGERLAYSWRSVAQADVAVSAASLAELHETFVFQRLYKDWLFTIR
jgi:hypothetical protein